MEERALQELGAQLKEREARVAVQEQFLADKDGRLLAREREVAGSQALLATLQSTVSSSG